MTCDHCSTEIGPDELAQFVRGARLHYFCATRMIVGSVGHQIRRCHCYGGEIDDPPGLSRREAALAAYFLNVGRQTNDAAIRSYFMFMNPADCDREN